MNYKKIYYPVKGLAVLSLVAVAIKYWMPTEIGFAFMLLPYLLLYFLANAKNYQNKRLIIIRFIAALFTIILAPVLIFGIEPDPQAGMGIMFLLIMQLAAISASEFIILFFYVDND
ncbi:MULTISPECIES: hypothetical protein [unclassified Pseudoalteromonas]|uniref:hypothetical protein n=1 Tax=unclassified Pseudoalteromonas TaxID=194690 RepID=UPI0015F66E01|nr:MULTISPECIES: hypothetical protein [unclassified Pseudoalteromonas]MBA6408429.1 hypothetical protein [Pseudoalteromonas sp. 5Ae-yellow]MDN3402710.1 hypothetical protein [Pseudoalteromonas sp. APC 3213]